MMLGADGIGVGVGTVVPTDSVGPVFAPDAGAAIETVGTATSDLVSTAMNPEAQVPGAGRDSGRASTFTSTEGAGG